MPRIASICSSKDSAISGQILLRPAERIEPQHAHPFGSQRYSNLQQLVKLGSGLACQHHQNIDRDAAGDASADTIACGVVTALHSSTAIVRLGLCTHEVDQYPADARRLQCIGHGVVDQRAMGSEHCQRVLRATFYKIEYPRFQKRFAALDVELNDPVLDKLVD